MNDSPWLLPAGINELLPADARRLEQMRRRLVDLFDSWGYDLVITPFIEYLESLLTGTGSDLDLQTFKLVDQLSGRTMGVRADMTPQVARIDAHHLRHTSPTRLCYLGTVLHTLPDGIAGSRSPYQIGAELYGHAGPESDAEVLCLMIEALSQVGIDDLYIDLGHVAIYRQLAKQAGLDAGQEAVLFDLLQRKALPEMYEYLNDLGISPTDRNRLAELATLNGDEAILAEARAKLSSAGKEVNDALDRIESVAGIVSRRLPDINLHYDLAELRGYHFHTGIVFAAYVAGHGQELARGGRYDDIGMVFGRPRPATGFSADLISVIALSEQDEATSNAIFAPWQEDPALHNEIALLRAKGERVVVELPGQEFDAAEMGCDRKLVQKKGKWQIVPVTDG